MINKILVPVDGSETSLQAAETAIGIAKQNQAKVTLLSVVVQHTANTLFAGVVPRAQAVLETQDALKKLMESDRKGYTKILDKLAQKFEENQVPVEKVIREGIASEEILAQSEEGKYDLIVIGNRGLSKTEKFFLGSVSERIVRRAKCSVLVVKQ